MLYFTLNKRSMFCGNAKVTPWSMQLVFDLVPQDGDWFFV